MLRRRLAPTPARAVARTGGSDRIAAPSGRALAPAAAWLAAALGLVWPAPARAHEHWFSPADYVAAPGQPVAVSVRIGEGLCGPRRPYRAERTVRFTLRAANTLDVAAVAIDGDSAWTRFEAADGSGAMLAWESNFVGHRMEAAEFDAYLASDGLDGPLAARRAARDTSAGRERYRRCSKLWLAGRAGAAGNDAATAGAGASTDAGASTTAGAGASTTAGASTATGEGDTASSRAAAGANANPARERATTPIGLPLEIVPLDVPGARPDLAVRVLFRGEALRGALVQAWHAPFQSGTSPRACDEERPAKAVWRGRTGADGVVRLRCAERGEWLIGTVHMISSLAPAEADWESTWASLAFGRLSDAGHR